MCQCFEMFTLVDDWRMDCKRLDGEWEGRNRGERVFLKAGRSIGGQAIAIVSPGEEREV